MSKNQSMRYRKDDEYCTPLNAVKIIEKYLKHKSRILCPFDKDDSNFVIYFKEKGHTVVNTHIDYGQDFFKMNVKSHFDYIISNPPFSKKTQVFEKLKQLGIPYAMLINLAGICDSKKRFEYFKDENFNIIYISPRVAYIKDGKQTMGSMFQSGYVTCNMLDGNKFEVLDGYYDDLIK